ncbi:MAG: hypothetical protein LIQ31_13925 [Planctomycetes bacterium]|nr:hypothetical protein [Planctomycetota bacterium]
MSQPCPSCQIHTSSELDALIVPEDPPFSQEEETVLRELARQVADLAARPIENEKRKLWTAHNDLHPIRPVSYMHPENGWNEIITQDQILSNHPLARVWEMRLRKKIYRGNVLKDDKVIEATFPLNHIATDSGWGLREERIGGEHGGAYNWKTPLNDYEEDIPKLRYPDFVIDWDKTNRLVDYAKTLFDSVLDVHLYRDWVYSVGLTVDFINLRGLEQLMMDFYDEPENVHKVMAFLREGYMRRLQRLEDNDLLCRNSGGEYVGSGGTGWTEQLPPRGTPGKVLLSERWGFAESQETVGVSPEMFEEFVFPYELPLLEKFGLACYGCCEPLDQRWHIVKQFKNLRRASVSAWADVEKMAENLQGNYVFSWKPNPSYLSTPTIDETRIRNYVRDTLEKTRGCVVEIVMKDNHTLGGNPDHAVTWCRIVREEIERRG